MADTIGYHERITALEQRIKKLEEANAQLIERMTTLEDEHFAIREEVREHVIKPQAARAQKAVQVE